jgi:toxin FitB
VTGMTGSELVLVDSSGWLEVLTADVKASKFRPYLSPGVPLVIPALVVYEVRRILLLRSNPLAADRFTSEVLRHNVASIDSSIAIEASSLSIKYNLHMADSIIYATALQRGARLITGDSHFANLPGVTIF